MQHIINMKLGHAQYGEGTLKSIKGNNMTVRFLKGEKSFAFPAALDGGELITTNEQDAERMKALKEYWAAISSGRVYVTKKQAELQKEWLARMNKEAAATVSKGKSKKYSASGFNFGKASFAVGAVMAALFVVAFIGIIIIAHILK